MKPENGTPWILLIVAALALLASSYPASAVKSNQYLEANRTCEQFADQGVLWSVLAAKGAAVDKYFNWSM